MLSNGVFSRPAPLFVPDKPESDMDDPDHGMPAPAPQATPAPACPASITDRDDEHRVRGCVLPPGHEVWHTDGWASWSDVTTPPASPPEKSAAAEEVWEVLAECVRAITAGDIDFECLVDRLDALLAQHEKERAK